MADLAAEKKAELESEALRKLQAHAGVAPRQTAERVDWMYDQAAANIKPTNDELMNKPVTGQSDKDLQDVKALNDGASGSLFLRNTTRTSEDMLRKLREDPLFQIRREEQAAKESMLQNPLIMARLQQKRQKAAKKEEKKAKKEAKKEEKRLKKVAKKEKKAAKKDKKAGKKKSSSSSSSSDSGAVRPDLMAQPVGLPPREPPLKKRSAPEAAEEDEHDSDHRSTRASRRETDLSHLGPSAATAHKDLSHLGPSANIVSKREEHSRRVAEQREKALASRGAPRRMSQEEREAKLRQMELDAKAHEQAKDQRIATAAQREKDIEEKEAKMRENAQKEHVQSYMKKMRADAYMDNEGSMADRLKTQRHRRQKNIVDPLERDQ